MDRDRDSIRTGASQAKDRSRNKRQASVLLGEIARHNCEHAAEKLIKESSRLVEESKKLRARARQLRQKKAS